MYKDIIILSNQQVTQAVHCPGEVSHSIYTIIQKVHYIYELSLFPTLPNRELYPFYPFTLHFNKYIQQTCKLLDSKEDCSIFASISDPSILRTYTYRHTDSTQERIGGKSISHRFNKQNHQYSLKQFIRERRNYLIRIEAIILRYLQKGCQANKLPT